VPIIFGGNPKIWAIITLKKPSLTPQEANGNKEGL